MEKPVITYFGGMKYLLLLLLLSSAASAQTSLTEIPLPCTVSNRNNEYSSLATYQNRIILMPQYPARYIYAIDTAYVDAVLAGQTPKDTLYEYRFELLYELLAKLHGYQGMEGSVVVGDQLFMSVETESYNDNGYVVRGRIAGKKIWMDTTHIITIPKLKKTHGAALTEAGHEAIAYLPQQNKLLVMFEYNNFADRSKAWLIDTSFTGVTEIPVQPFPFRITDLHEKNGQLWGINYYYNGEYDEYEPTLSLKKENGEKADWRKDCVGRLVKVNVTDKGISVTPTAPFIWACDNWEGILQYKQGVLMITDQFPVTRFVYLPF
jgi:hypothetical protein